MAGTEDTRESAGHEAVAPPGWYPNPMNASQALWWDGERWGDTPSPAQDTGWRLANDARSSPPGQPGMWIPGPPPIEPPRVRRSSTRWWIWVIVAVGCGLAAGLVLLGLMTRVTVITGDELVYEEDFSTGAGQFEIWEEPQGSAAVVDGVYVMTNRNLGKSLTVGVTSIWAAERARIDADMELTEAGNRGGFGLYLARTDGQDYVFAVVPGAGARITGPGLECRGTSTLANVRGGEIALSGEQEADQGSGTTLTGYLDGRAVVTCVDQGFNNQSAGAFAGAGLWLRAEEEPATAQVDNVTITSHR